MAILFADDCFFDHLTGRHPESPGRLRAVYDHLQRTGLRERFARGTVQPASREQLLRVHGGEHIDAVKEFADGGGGRIEIDTVVSPRSFEVALRAAGAAAAAVDAVLAGPHRRAVCLARPPGHHALANAPMGFCLFNNIAVAAKQAQVVHGLSRILIVDWDVHHGNGTQDIFYESAEVYFLSAHRYPFYPGTGTEDENGSGPGVGTTFNLPLPFGTTRREYRDQFSAVLDEAARRCRPELVLVSAGFDAHAADPIGSLGLESEDFGELTQTVGQVADQYCHGRIVSLLEGGYDPQALAESVAIHLETLLAGEEPPKSPSRSA